MKSAHRIALSLLISVVVFSIFAVIAFSGFFAYLETEFYNRRVTDSIKMDLEKLKYSIEEYHETYFNRFSAIIRQEFIARAFLPNLSREDLFLINNTFGTLQSEYPGILGIRLIDERGSIHFSTFDRDIRLREDFRIAYNRLQDVEPIIGYSDLLTSEAGNILLYFDGANRRILYILKIYDSLNRFRGSAVFSLSLQDLKQHLLQRGVLELGKEISLVQERGYLFNISQTGAGFLEDTLLMQWVQRTEDSIFEPIPVSYQDRDFYIFSVYSGKTGFIGYMVSGQQFALDDSLKILLLVSLFLTCFLVTFLLFSVRQDKVLVLSQRIKRFQINFIKEYLENKESLDLDRWRRDISSRGDEVKKEIKRGLGRIKQDKQAEVDNLIDSSWNELLSLVDKKIEASPVSKIDVSNLEEVILKVLSRADLLTQLPQTEKPKTLKRAPSEPIPQSSDQEFEEAEELAEAEELEEAEELAEADELEEAEELAEAEELEEAEELAEAEELEEAEELAEAEELEEAEELAEAEELEEAEEFAEAEELEEAEELAEAEELEEAEEFAEAEEIEAAGAEAEELEVAEPQTEAEEPEGPAELTETEELAEAEEPEGPAEAAEPAELEEAGELAEAEELEEAEEFAEAEELEEAGELAETAEADKVEIAYIENEFKQQEAVDNYEELAPVEEVEIGEVELVKVSGDYRGYSIFYPDYQGRFMQGKSRKDEELEELVPQESGSMEDASELIEVETSETALTGLSSMAEKDEEKTAAEAASLEEEDLLEEIEDLDEIEELEESEDLEDLEELGEVEELAPDEPEVMPVETIEELISGGKIRIFSMEDLISSINRDKEIIYEQNGIFSIKEDTILASTEPKDKELKNLVDSLLEEEGPAQEEKDVEIGDILGIHSVDLPLDGFEVGKEQDMSQEESYPLEISSAGILFDLYLRNFKPGTMGIIKALMKLSRKTDSLYAAVLVFKGENTLETEYSLGLDQLSRKQLHFNEGEEIFKTIFNKELGLYSRIHKTGFRELDEKYSEKDSQYLQGVIYLPISFKETRAYLFLGLKDNTIELEEYLFRIMEK